MDDEGKTIQPEHVFKKAIWRSTLGISETMEQATTWSIAGIGAIVGLLISNLDSVAQLVSREGIRWGLFLFTASLVAGAISKQVGMAVTKGIDLIQKLESLLGSERGQALMDQLSIEPRFLIKEIAEPFFWPLSTLMRKSGLRGLKDYLSSDKRFVKLFCAQLIFVYIHGICAASGLVVIAASIV